MNKITIEEHKMLAKNLRKARLKILLSKNKFDKKAVKLIDQLRDVLEEIMIRDNPKMGDNFMEVYYGPVETN